MKRFPLIIFLIAFNALIESQDLNPLEISNLSDRDLELAKEQLNKLASSEGLIELEKPIVDESTVKNDDLKALDSNLVPDKKYGYDFFSSMPTTISAVGDLPLPNDYKISLRDQFTIILSGSKESIFDLEVKLDGTILFPELGSISVVNETLGEVRTKLENLIEQSYVGVKIDISIKELAAKKITIVGAVKTPGTYLVNPFSTITSALGFSGGISEIGTLRNIVLKRINGETFKFDLYKLLINGDRSDDITVEAGDVIIVGPAEQFINLSGQVKRPAIYEILVNESLNDLINYGLGFTDIANKNNLSLQILDTKSASIQELKTNDLASSINNVLSVNVNAYLNKNLTNVKVSGSIKEPGLYYLSEAETLKDLIENLEFVDVYPWLAVLEKFDEKKLVKSTILFSLKDPSTYESIKLVPNSTIYFANIFDRAFLNTALSSETLKLIRDYTLDLSHKENNYLLPIIGKFNVEELVEYLGLDMSDVEEEATYISPINDLIVKRNYFDMEFASSKYHTLSFRSPVNDIIKVKISGAIDFPGTYSLKSNSTLSDLYNLVGKFKNEAFLEGIILKRASVRDRQIQAIEQSRKNFNSYLLSTSLESEEDINISLLQSLFESIDESNLGRVSGNFGPQSEAANSSILFDNDEIIVPKNPNVINVLGEVFTPTTFEFNSGLSVEAAITFAGGYNASSDKSRVYVIKANGLVERKGRNIFQGKINLEPGDTVVVPRKVFVTNPVSRAIIPITTILSDLAFSAAAIESLSNN